MLKFYKSNRKSEQVSDLQPEISHEIKTNRLENDEMTLISPKCWGKPSLVCSTKRARVQKLLNNDLNSLACVFSCWSLLRFKLIAIIYYSINHMLWSLHRITCHALFLTELYSCCLSKSPFNFVHFLSGHALQRLERTDCNTHSLPACLSLPSKYTLHMYVHNFHEKKMNESKRFQIMKCF